MRITPEAQLILNETFTANETNCLKAMLQKTCCSTQVVFYAGTLTDDDQPTNVDGVNVIMDDATKERTETVTIDVVDGNLVINDSAKSGCC